MLERLSPWRLAMLLSLFCANAWSDETQKYEWLTHGVKSGSLVLTISAEDGTRSTRFEYNDRGRGPEIHEITRFDRSGQVTGLQISGHSYMGAKADESLQRSETEAQWRSTLENGSSDDVDAFYLANDGSPEQKAILVRALLASEDGRLDLLPNGSAGISKLDEFEAESESGSKLISLYAISGIGMDPNFIWLDSENELFGLADGSFAMAPEGWSHVMDSMQARQDVAEREYYRTRSVPLMHALPERYAIANANVVDVESGALLKNHTVTVSDGHIEEVSESPPASGRHVVDAMGGTLIPGLWDMHTHIRASQGLLHLAAGVTTVRDMGNNPDRYMAVRDRFNSNEVVGPRSFAAGIIEGRSPFSAPIRTLLDTQEDALDLVRSYSEMGYPQIKIYSSAHPDWIEAVAAEAHRLGMRVSGHVPAFMTAEQAVRAGYDEIQHINMLFLNFLAGPEDDTRTPVRFSMVAEKGASLDLESAAVAGFLELLKSNDVVIDPTVAIFHNMFRHRSGEMSPSFAMVAEHFPPAVKRGMLAGRMDINEENAAQYEAASTALLNMLAKLHENGIKIVAGTDSLPGFGLHRELELYQQAGIPAAEVLKLATLGSARLMNASNQSGSIAPGKWADMVLLSANPLEDISALRTTRLVFKGDRYFKPSQMYEAVGIKPFNH